jgi:hypothetical protein
MFGPAHLLRRERDPLGLPSPSAKPSEDARLGAAAADGAAETAFDGQLAALLGADTTTAAALAGIDAAADTSYDFDEYVFLRNVEDPYVDPRHPEAAISIAADPRMTEFVSAVRAGIASAVESIRIKISAEGGASPNEDTLAGLVDTMTHWWRAVCSVRAFNRLALYSPTDMAAHATVGVIGVRPDYSYYYYAEAVAHQLDGDASIRSYLESGGGDLAWTSADFWEMLHDGVFRASFEEKQIAYREDGDDDFGFDPFPVDEVLFGLQVVHRQSWQLLAYGRGEMVRSIPLGPRESQRVSVKVTNRTKVTRGSEVSTGVETTTESSTTTKDTTEVVAEASEKLNMHAEAEVGGGFGAFVQAKISGGISSDQGSSSRDTKSRLNETMSKTAGRMKRDTKMTVSTESDNTYEVERSSELSNPNDELAVTYLYHRLQQRYWVSTRIAEVHSVVFVPERLPLPSEINEGWLARHGDVIAGALLDPGLGGVLAAIRKEPLDSPTVSSEAFKQAAESAIGATKDYRNYVGQGTMPDFLASGQQYLERDLERQTARASEKARRTHQSAVLVAHVRRNILHYMRAIWRSEDFDQRMQRYGRRRVPTMWTFVPRDASRSGGEPVPLDVDGVFVPAVGSERCLNQVIDPIGPIGYLFNCAIYRLRDDLRLANAHQALAWLRSAYTRFVVTATPSVGSALTVRQATAVAPRRTRDQMSIIYRASSGRWVLPGAPGIEFLLDPPLDGMVEVAGIRVWLDGTPADGDEIRIRLATSGELEDPHVRMVRATSPLPSSASEADVFDAGVLRQMALAMPEVGRELDGERDWTKLTEAQQKAVRNGYHEWLVLKESGRLVPLETNNVILEVAAARTPVLEPFKLLHRYVDVVRERENTRRLRLENDRRQALLDKGRLGDPDIDRVSLVSAQPSFAALVDTGEDPNNEGGPP